MSFKGLNDIISGPDANSVTTWTYDGFVTVWNYRTGTISKRLQVTYPNNYSAATFSSDGKFLATGVQNNVINVWDWSQGKQLTTLYGHSDLVRLVRYSPTEHLLASGSYDGTIKIWKLYVEEDEKPSDEIVTERDTVYIVQRDTVKIYVRDTVYIEKPNPVVSAGDDDETTTEITKDESSISEDDLEVGNTINLEHIQFERGKAIFLRESYPKLGKWLELLRKHPTMEIRLEGHTDNIGKAHLNLRLSGERVRAVKDYLTGKGIKGGRIFTRAYGDTRPIASNKKESTRRLKRRVEVTILKL